jgi:rfaE bifunctional protein nucleotidyltransferase chain/domain
MVSVALAAGAALEDAVPLANIAGGLEVSKFGCVAITRDEVQEELRRTRDSGAGKLRRLPELLVVGLNTDASVRRQNKGDDRPLRSEQQRARMIAALEAVDYVVLFDDPSVLSLVQQIAPDVLVKGGDYRPEQVVGAEWVKSRGGRVVVIPFVEGFSTTGEVERIRGGRV